MVSARGSHRSEGFQYAIDNGAWTSYQRGETFDVRAFERCIERLGSGADFIVVPDIVARGRQSLDFSLEWLTRLDGLAPLMLAVQDGITEDDVDAFINPNVGVFVGGSTAWKLSTMSQWARLARKKQALVHVGRVNSARRIHLCVAAGVDSIDGSSASRYAVTTQRLTSAARQLSLIECV